MSSTVNLPNGSASVPRKLRGWVLRALQRLVEDFRRSPPESRRFRRWLRAENRKAYR